MTSDVAQWSGLFAAAAEDPRRWPACLARLARTWSADDARLVPLPPVAGCPVGEIAVGEGGRTLRAYLAPHPWCIALELTRAAASGAFAAEDLQRLRVAIPKLIAATAAARQVILCAEPLVEQAANPMQPRRLLVTLIDPSASETAESGLYRALFDLTPREAEIASLVAMGWPLQAICSAVGISLGHCRQRLQSVFRKTGTTRQGELAALLGRIR